MATNLSSFIHELRERIAASSSSPPNTIDDEALGNRFRAVLPNLLHAYVVPSSSASEREVVAVLKLISHIAKNLPGVFYNGKASAVLPLIVRILPFFAEPAFRARHGVIFETVGSLLSLLRIGARDFYCKFFVDAMLAVEDLLYAASVSAETTMNSGSARLTLKCFYTSCDGALGDPTCLSDLPASIKPQDGVGILIDVTGKMRWQPFATWILKLISKCLTEGTLYVEGLVNLPHVSAACSLLCYVDADLHMACFDFVRIIGSVIDKDIIPYENLIRSISAILSEGKEGFPVFRDLTYDSSIAGCLATLHSSCPEDVVKLTAADLINVFLGSMWRTKSQELKVALCSAYTRIARTCHPHIWRPDSLIHILCLPEPCPSLINCLHVTLSILGPERVGGGVTNNVSVGLPTSCNVLNENYAVGEKRRIQNIDNMKTKRSRFENNGMAADADYSEESKVTQISNDQYNTPHLPAGAFLDTLDM